VKPYPKDWEPVYIETEQTDHKVKVGYAQKKSLYGLTKEQFIELAERQGYLCLICDADGSEEPYRLAVDHDYETNEIRGLLCTSCNYALGLFQDDPKKLLRAVHYLDNSGTGVFIPETGSKETI